MKLSCSRYCSIAFFVVLLCRFNVASPLEFPKSAIAEMNGLVDEMNKYDQKTTHTASEYSEMWKSILKKFDYTMIAILSIELSPQRIDQQVKDVFSRYKKFLSTFIADLFHKLDLGSNKGGIHHLYVYPISRTLPTLDKIGEFPGLSSEYYLSCAHAYVRSGELNVTIEQDEAYGSIFEKISSSINSLQTRYYVFHLIYKLIVPPCFDSATGPTWFERYLIQTFIVIKRIMNEKHPMRSFTKPILVLIQCMIGMYEGNFYLPKNNDSFFKHLDEFVIKYRRNCRKDHLDDSESFFLTAQIEKLEKCAKDMGTEKIPEKIRTIGPICKLTLAIATAGHSSIKHVDENTLKGRISSLEEVVKLYQAQKSKQI